jgi:hypothetical protein
MGRGWREEVTVWLEVQEQEQEQGQQWEDKKRKRRLEARTAESLGGECGAGIFATDQIKTDHIRSDHGRELAWAA